MIASAGTRASVFTILSYLMLGGIILGAENDPAAKAAKDQVAKTFDARRKSIETLLKSGNSEQVAQGLADIKKCFLEDLATGETMFWRTHAQIQLTPPNIENALELIDLSLKAKATSKKPDRIGYLQAYRACCLFIQDRPDEAKTAFRKGLSVDSGGAIEEAVKIVPKQLNGAKKYDDLVSVMMQIICLMPHDPKTVEPALKQCINSLNMKGKYADSLPLAKCLFNISTMETTSDALAILDRQLGLVHIEDRGVVEKFRKEQNDGVNAPLAGEQARVCQVLKDIQIDSGLYRGTLENIVDDSFDSALRHVALLLLSDQATDAFALAKRAYALAGNAKEMALATDMIARCIKAQDGTIGRANAWIAAPASSKN